MINNIYLLCGPELGEKEEYIKAYINNFQKKTGEAPEIYRFYPFETRMIDVVSLLKNGSLFSSNKIVILHNIEEIKAKQELDLLVEYMKSPAGYSTLFLLTDKIKNLPAKVEKNITKDNKKIFWELFENKKIDWIRQFFKRKNMTIETEAIKYLIKMVENNTKDFRQECEKLSLFFNRTPHLKVEDLEKYIYHSKQENVFTLFEYIAERDLSGAQEVLNKLVLSRETDPVTILSGILWQVRQLNKFQRLLQNNFQEEDAFKKLNITNKKSRRIYLTASKNYSIKDIEKIIQLISEFDIRIKSVKTELQNLMLELFIYYLISRKGRWPSL